MTGKKTRSNYPEKSQLESDTQILVVTMTIFGLTRPNNPR